MDLFITLGLVCLFVISIILNAIQYRKLSHQKKHTGPESYEVTQLLHDLTAGHAMVKIVRVAPTDVFIRSAKGRL